MFFRLFGVRVPPSSSRDAARRNVERTSSMALGDWDEVAVGKQPGLTWGGANIFLPEVCVFSVYKCVHVGRAW